MHRPLRIAQVAPPLERVPPLAYGGTERIVHGLVVELDRRGHEVTTFASGDSEVPGRHIATVPEALRPAGYVGDPLPWFHLTMREVIDRAHEFDLIHSHLEWASLLLARTAPIPVVSTFHGRLDLPWAETLLRDAPRGLVAISNNQASAHPEVAWEAVVHNGLRLDDAPFDRRRGESLCFVGRVAPEKGIVDAIEVAKAAGRPLRIAAKIAPGGTERAYYEEVFKPALDAAGSDVEFLGELSQADRDQLFAESYASLMPGSWPEPFGLVAIEALATGTPVIARRIGALPEIIRDGVDGFFGDDVTAMAFTVDRVASLDREAIRASVLDRFSAERMTDGYEAVYRTVLAAARDGLSAGRTGGPASGGSEDPVGADDSSLIPADRLAAKRDRPSIAVSSR
jgi:glycosyltransferase involved in cell wall biosynthesis